MSTIEVLKTPNYGKADYYSFNGKISRVRHALGLLLGFPCVLCLLLLACVGPLRNVIFFQHFYQFSLHMHTCWCHITLRLLGIEVIECGDEAWELRQDAALLLGDQTDLFALSIIEQTLAPYSVISPYLSMVDRPSHWFTFINIARRFYIFESMNSEKIRDLEKCLKKNYPQLSATYDEPVANFERQFVDNQKKISQPGIAALQSILNKFDGRNGNRGIKWIMHVYLIFEKDITYSKLFEGDINNNSKIFLVKRLYPADEIPREKEALCDWCNELIQNEKNTHAFFNDNGFLPQVEGYSTLPPRPLRVGSYAFALTFTVYLYFVYSFVLHPIFKMLFYDPFC